MKGEIIRVNNSTFEKLHTREQMLIESAARSTHNRFIQELRRLALPRMTFDAFRQRQNQRKDEVQK